GRRRRGFPGGAAGPDGSVYIAFNDSTSPASGAIGILRSRDGGRTWSSSRLPGVSAFAFEPAIAVDSHGTVGGTWYDMRNDRAGDDAVTADVWFAHSGDHGATWRQGAGGRGGGPRRRAARGPARRQLGGRIPGAGRPARPRVRRHLHPGRPAGPQRAHRHLLRPDRARLTPARRAARRMDLEEDL